MILLRAVEPVFERRVTDPSVLRADVVCDLVLNDLDSEGVRALYKFAQGLHRAEAVFDRVVVVGVVAVVVGVRTPRLATAVDAVPVVVPGREPDGRDAQLFQVRQAVDDAAEVAAVPRARVASVVRFRRSACGRVVRAVAVREAVGHDEVDNVVGRDALKIFIRVERRVDAEGEGRVARAVVND